MLIISPHYPPTRGGVADHTASLARELAVRRPVKVLASPGVYRGNGVEVVPLTAGWHKASELLNAIEDLAPDGPILWQYVPHMYGRGGVNSTVPKVMAVLARKGRQQIVIAHEIAAPLSLLPHHLAYALAHRRQWQSILRSASAIGISTEAWVLEWSARTPQYREKFCLLPSPSSLPVVPQPAEHRERWRQRLVLPPSAKVLAYFGALNATGQLRQVTDAWRAAQTARTPVALVIIGSKPKWQPPAGLKALYRPLGYQIADDVSAAMQGTDLLALPFTDGVSERRTSFMAGLAHGCPVVTTFGSNTGPALRAATFFAAAEAGDSDAFTRLPATLLADEKRLRALGQAGRTAYQHQYDWPAVLRTLEKLLARP